MGDLVQGHWVVDSGPSLHVRETGLCPRIFVADFGGFGLGVMSGRVVSRCESGSGNESARLGEHGDWPQRGGQKNGWEGRKARED